MDSFHCKTVKNTAFGAVGNYPYSAELYNADNPAVITVRFILSGNLSGLVGWLHKNPIEYIKFYSAQTADGMAVLVGEVAPPTDFYIKSTLHSLLHLAKHKFAEFELTPPAECPLCHNTGCDAYAFLEEAYRPTHAACVKNRLQLPSKDETLPSMVTGRYSTGILGALLGAFIGILPLLAQVMAQGKLTTPLYAFVPILSALLFRLLRGKANRAFSAICVLLSSFVAVYIMEIFLYWVVLSSGAGHLIGFWESALLYFSSHSLQQTARDMFFTLLFTLVGFFPSTVILRRYAANGTVGGKTIRGAEFVNQSLHLFAEEKEPAPQPEPAPEKKERPTFQL